MLHILTAEFVLSMTWPCYCRCPRVNERYPHVMSSPSLRRSCSVDSCAFVRGENASYLGFTEISNLGMSHQAKNI